VAEIRGATWDDFDAVYGLLEARSRAAFGISQEKPEYLRQRWELPANGKWVVVQDGVVIGYAGLDENQDFVHAATDPDVGDGLLAHVEQQARTRGFGHVAATAVPEDEPLYSALQRNRLRARSRDTPDVAHARRPPPRADLGGRRRRPRLHGCRRRARAGAARRCIRRLGPRLCLA